MWYLGRWWEGLYLDAGASADDRRQLARVPARDRSAGRRGATRRAGARSRSRARRGTDDPARHRARSDLVRGVARRARPDLAAAALAVRLRVPRRLRAAPPPTTSAWAGMFYFAARQRGPGAPSQTVVTWPERQRRARRAAREVARRSRRASRCVDIADDRHDDRDRTATARSASARDARDRRDADASSRTGSSRRGAASRRHGDYGAWVVANVHLRDAADRARPRRAAGVGQRVSRQPEPGLRLARRTSAAAIAARRCGPGTTRSPTTMPRACASKLAGAGYAEWAEVDPRRSRARAPRRARSRRAHRRRVLGPRHDPAARRRAVRRRRSRAPRAARRRALRAHRSVGHRAVRGGVRSRPARGARGRG